MEPEEKGCGKIRGVWDACLAEDEESGTAKCEEHPASCSLTRRAGRSAETAAGRRGPSSLVSGGRTLPCRRAPRSPGTHPPARGAPGRARQSGPDRRPGVGTRRGQTRALSGSHARHPALLVSRPAASAGSRSFLHLQADLGPAPLSSWSWASLLPALNLRFHVCKVGAGVPTSRGCGETEEAR